MKSLMIPSIFALLVSAPAVALAAPAAASATVTAEASANIEVSDDILLVLDLPIAAADLRDSGVDDAEISDVIDGTVEGGASAAEATEALASEREEIKARGHKKGLGLYVRSLLLAGYRGQELAAKIKERTEDFTLTDEEKATLKADLKAKHDAEKARRKELHAKIVAARKEGKVVKIGGELLHARLDERRLAERAKHAGKVHKIKAEIRAERRDGDGDKDALKELHGELHEEKADHHEKMEKLDKREDKLDKREDKLDSKLDKRSDRIEDRQEKREDRREKVKDNIQAKKAAAPAE